MKNLLREWKSTLLGILTILLTVLFTAGVIDLHQKEESLALVSVLLENVESIIAVLAGFALLFAKDYDSKNRD